MTTIDTSEDVFHLIQSVERLPREDQEKILHIVDLLSLVPVSVQDRTQQMLRDLLESEPESRMECSAAVDAVIEYLERSVVLGTEQRGAFAAATLRGSARIC